MNDKEEVSEVRNHEKSEKDKASNKVFPERNKKTKEKIYFTQPPSDSAEDICGPLDCDKQL